MTGSIRDFSYEDDAGKKHAVLIDESNGKMQGWTPSQGFIPLFDAATPPFPSRITKGLKMRQVSGVAAYTNLGKRKRFYVGSRDSYNKLRASYSFVYDASQNQWWEIVRSYNEKYPTKPLVDIDTGITDGSQYPTT